MGEVNIFMIDAPWSKKKGGIRKSRPNQKRSLDYQTMPTDEIFSLLDDDIFSLASKNHCVFMWTIESFLIECELEMEKRGYKRHCRMVWNKLNGVAPAFTVRYTHEYLIWYYKDKLLPISQDYRGKYPTVFEEKAREHSRKPEISYEIIKNLYPNELKMDVFSRQSRCGWLQYGDQKNIFNEKQTLLFV